MKNHFMKSIIREEAVITLEETGGGGGGGTASQKAEAPSLHVTTSGQQWRRGIARAIYGSQWPPLIAPISERGASRPQGDSKASCARRYILRDARHLKRHQLQWITKNQQASEMAQSVTFLPCIQEKSSSNLGRDSEYPD